MSENLRVCGRIYKRKEVDLNEKNHKRAYTKL